MRVFVRLVFDELVLEDGCGTEVCWFLAMVVADVEDDGDDGGNVELEAEDKVETTDLEIGVVLVDAMAELAADDDEAADAASVDEAVVPLEAPLLAHAKLIFVTGVPESLGALKSQVMSTNGQQILSPMVA